MELFGVIHLVSLVIHIPAKDLWLKFRNPQCLVDCIWSTLWEVSGSEFSTTYCDSSAASFWLTFTSGISLSISANGSLGTNPLPAIASRRSLVRTLAITCGGLLLEFHVLHELGSGAREKLCIVMFSRLAGQLDNPRDWHIFCNPTVQPPKEDVTADL